MPDNETQEPGVPVKNINDPVNPMDVRLNFNCLIYLFTEQMAMFNGLIQVLKEQNKITIDDIQNIYGVTGNKETLAQVYQAVFQRFIEYYGSLREEVEREEEAQDFSPPPNPAFDFGTTSTPTKPLPLDRVGSTAPPPLD